MNDNIESRELSDDSAKVAMVNLGYICGVDYKITDGGLVVLSERMNNDFTEAIGRHALFLDGDI